MKFNKQLPGADIIFQPEDIADYKDDAWDVRISIGDSPLEEAYYFTIEDPGAVRKTIRELLDDYALNPNLKDSLDVTEYPELPFIQDELIQYIENDKKGLLKLDFYVNNYPEDRLLQLSQTAERLLNVCTYHDMSHDYRVLDLIIVPEVPHSDNIEIRDKQSKYGYIFLLLLLDYYYSKGERAFKKFLAKGPMASAFDIESFHKSGLLSDGLDNLNRRGFIEIPNQGGYSVDKKKANSRLSLTEKGANEIATIKNETLETAQLYNCFDSVSIYPCALGVPEGFDARVQMMEYDGRDYEREILLQVLSERRDEIYNKADWYEMYETFAFYDVVKEALAYMTNFSKEILDALKELAEG